MSNLRKQIYSGMLALFESMGPEAYCIEALCVALVEVLEYGSWQPKHLDYDEYCQTFIITELNMIELFLISIAAGLLEEPS